MKKRNIRAAIILLPITILLAAAFLKWETLSYYAFRKVAGIYAAKAGINLTIGEITGNPFTETVLEDISAAPETGKPKTYQLAVQSLTCTYDLWSLRNGIEPFIKGLSCSAEFPAFSYDLRSYESKDQTADGPTQSTIPVILPRLDLNNGSVVFSVRDWQAELQGLHSVLQSPSEKVHTLQLEVEDFRFSRDGATKIATDLQVSLQMDGTSLHLDIFTAGAQEVRATGFFDLKGFKNGFVEFGAELFFSGNKLQVVGTLDKQLLTSHISTERFDIGELQKRLNGPGWDFTGSIMGDVDLAYDMSQDKDLAVSFDLKAVSGRFRDQEYEHIAVIGSIERRIFTFSRAVAEFSDNIIQLLDTKIPLPLLLKGDMPAILEGTEGQFGLEITDPEPVLKLISAEKDLFPGELQLERVTATGYLKEGVLQLEKGEVVTNNSALSIEAAKLSIPADSNAFETAEIDGQVHFQTSKLREIIGFWEGVDLDGRGTADIRIRGTVKEPNADVILRGEYLNYNEMELGTLSLKGDIQIEQELPGVVKSVTAILSELTQTNGSGTLSLLDEAKGIWQPGIFSGEATFQLDDRGEVSLAIKKEPQQDLSLEMITRDLDSSGWLAVFMDSRIFFQGADTEAVLSDPFNDAELQFSGTVAKIGSPGIPHPLSGSFDLHYSTRGIKISEFFWESQTGNRLILNGFLPYDPRAEKPFLDTNLIINGQADFKSLEDVAFLLAPLGVSQGSLKVDMKFRGSWNQPEGGSWYHGFSLKELLHKHPDPWSGEISAKATVMVKDLNILKKYLPWLRRFNGDLGGTVSLSGPVSNPAINGSVSLAQGEISHTFNFPMLKAVKLEADFDRESLTIRQMQADVGGSPVALNGLINLEDDAVDVYLHLDGKNLLIFRNNDLRLRGDVKLDVTGPLDHLAVEGTTGLTGGYYTKNFDFLSLFGSSSTPVSRGVNFLFSFSEPPLNDASFDVKITTIEPLRIRNNLIRGSLRPELLLKGTGELPYLVGTVYIDPSRVLLPSGRLQIQSGLLRFLEEEPDRPQLDLLANSKILGYDINVVFEGPLSDPIINLSSSPALPNDELLLLLLTGQPPRQDLAGGARGSGTQNVMVYLGRDFLNRWLEDESAVSDERLLDRFELDYGRDVTRTGEQTIETSFRLSEQVTETGIIYYLTGEKDKYDAYNYGLKLVLRFE